MYFWLISAPPILKVRKGEVFIYRVDRPLLADSVEKLDFLS